MQNTKDITYNVAKPWQLYVFSVHDVMLNCFLYVMGFISYLATGYYGILATTAAVIATGSRIFDAITDPVVAFIIERTDGRFGRYRPMMALGWVITSLAILGLFFFCVPSGNLAIYLLLYVVYVIGYSFMMTAHGGARSAFTNEPAQRNKLGFLMGVWSKVFYMVMGVVLSSYLMVKHGGMNLEAMQELVIIMLIASFVVLVLTIIALGDRDVPENYRNVVSEKVSLKDMFRVITKNRNFQMVLVACASDRIALTVSASSVVMIAVWGIVAGNYGFYGKLGVITFIPSVILSYIGTKYATKTGKKESVVRFSWIGIICSVSIVLLFVIGDPTKIGSGILMTALFLIIYCIHQGCQGVTSSLKNPMLADVADADMCENGGKQMASIVNAAYCLVDKCVVAFATTITGYGFAAVGYVTSQPQVGDPSSPAMVAMSLAMWMGLIIIGLILSLIAMRFYNLDNERMVEVQKWIAARKAETK